MAKPAHLFSRGWKRLSGAEGASLLPQTRLSGPMPWVIAIMVALTVIAAAAALALGNLANRAFDELSGGVTVQIMEPSADSRVLQTEAAARALRAADGVEEVHIVPKTESEGLIEPWLGTQLGEGDAVPVPSLIDVRMVGVLSPERLEAMRRQVRAVAPAAQIDAEAGWLQPVIAAINALRWLAGGLILLLSSALAAAVLLATRSALGQHRDTIEIVHLLGGTDNQVAQVFQRSTGVDAAAGGAVGFVLAVVVIEFFGGKFAGLGTGLAGGGSIQLVDWLLLLLIPLIGIGLAVLTARFSIMRALRRMV